MRCHCRSRSDAGGVDLNFESVCLSHQRLAPCEVTLKPCRSRTCGFRMAPLDWRLVALILDRWPPLRAKMTEPLSDSPPACARRPHARTTLRATLRTSRRLPRRVRPCPGARWAGAACSGVCAVRPAGSAPGAGAASCPGFASPEDCPHIGALRKSASVASMSGNL